MTRESGIYGKWMDNVLIENRAKLGTLIKTRDAHICDFNDISLLNIYDVFYLLVFGFSLSFSLFLIEHIIKFAYILYSQIKILNENGECHKRRQMEHIQPGVTMRQIRRKHLFVKPFISYSYLNSYPFSPFVKN